VADRAAASQEELESVETALARYTLRINELRKSLAVPSPEPGALGCSAHTPAVARAHRPALRARPSQSPATWRTRRTRVPAPRRWLTSSPLARWSGRSSCKSEHWHRCLWRAALSGTARRGRFGEETFGEDRFRAVLKAARGACTYAAVDATALGVLTQALTVNGIGVDKLEQVAAIVGDILFAEAHL
jgi:hypothetical protein